MNNEQLSQKSQNANELKEKGHHDYLNRMITRPSHLFHIASEGGSTAEV